MFNEDEKYILKMILKHEIEDVKNLLDDEKNDANELLKYLQKIEIIAKKLS